MKTSLIFKQLFGTILFFSLIFISAGTLSFWQGWVYVIIGIIMMVLSLTVFRLDSELMEERSKPGAGVKSWDKLILGLSFLVTLGMYVTAGFDSGRYHRPKDINWIAFSAGVFMTISGQLLFLIAQKQNKFFSSTVRIQYDRGHTVCDTGLYKIVRHPAYLGSIIQATGFPLLFCSPWSVIPVSVLILLFVIRTHFEDKTLNTELKGYSEYSSITRYKLVPFIW